MLRLGPLVAEVIEPESEKFTAPLLLVHGLWERAPVWRRFAGYLAHRGWRCIAPARRADPDADFSAHLNDLRAASAALAAPPVIVGHDVGALLALACADRARAVVGIAPLVPPPLAAPSVALQRAGSWLQRWRGTALHAPRGAWRVAYPDSETVEPRALIAQLLAGSLAGGAAVGSTPAAVFAMRDDEVTREADSEALAKQVGAESYVLDDGGHAILNAPRWERSVGAVHRWIVQRLGVDLLALYEEAMQPPE